jgi:hypothetical protein
MWETSLWARLIASASEPGNHHQGYRGYVAHNNVLRGYEFRSGDARREKQIEGQSMETSEKKGVALPTRQACCPGTAGGNNYRRFPHGFPQEAWKTATTPAGRKHAERSMSRKRRVRRFSPAEGKPTFLFPENTLLCRRDNACRLVACRTASGAGGVNCGCTLVL